MSSTDEVDATHFQPPDDSAGLRAGAWCPVSTEAGVARYLTGELWPHSEMPQSWQVARRSAAVYVYREQSSGWAVAAKFYAQKTGVDAAQYAQREHDWLCRVREADLENGAERAVRPMSVCRGTLFLEYVPGLTLEDLIAVRRSRPGNLAPALVQAARFLARLHDVKTSEGDAEPLAARVDYAHKVVGNLSRYGVLQDEPWILEGLGHLIDRWAGAATLASFAPSVIHGDATTTNFIYPDQEAGVVAIDWERAKITDPASDVGRLMAEVEHAVRSNGGNGSEAQPLLESMLETYLQTREPAQEDSTFEPRARFYQAVSSLRIARNGWLPRLERTALVARSLALLSSSP